MRDRQTCHLLGYGGGRKGGVGKRTMGEERRKREAEAAYPSHKTSVIIHNAGGLRLVPQGSPQGLGGSPGE